MGSFHTFSAALSEMDLRRTQLALWHTEVGVDEDFNNAGAVWDDKSMHKYFNGLDANARVMLLSIADDIIMTGLNQFIIGEHPSNRVVLPRASHPETPGGKKNREEHARRLQDAHDALVWKIEKDASESPFRTVGYHQLGLGLGVLAYPILWDRWPKHPMKDRLGKDVPYRRPEESWRLQDRKRVSEWRRVRTGPLPWDVHAEHPKRVLFDIHHDPPEDVFIESNVLPGVYLDKYPELAAKSLTTNAPESRPFVIYCSREEYGLWYEGKPLLTSKDGANTEGFAKNRTGILWYRMAQGGFGNQGYGNEWHLRIQGITRRLRPVIITKIIDYNVMGIMRRMYGIPLLKMRGTTLAEAGAAASRIAFGTNQVFTYTTEALEAVELPSINPAVFQELEESDRMIERHTWSDVLRGTNPASETASGAGQRLSQGQAALRNAKRNYEQLIEGMLDDLDHMTKYELQEPLELLSRDGNIIELDPDDVVDGMRNIVNSKPATEEEKMAERRETIALIDARLRSRYTALVEDPDVLDPEEEMARIMADAAVESEAWIDSISAEALGGGVPQGGESKAAPAVSPLDQGSNRTQPLVAPSEVGQAVSLPPLRRG